MKIDDIKQYKNPLIITPRSNFKGYLAMRRTNPHLAFSLKSFEDVIDDFFYQADDRVLREILKKGEDYNLALAYVKAIKSPNLKETTKAKFDKLKTWQEEFLKEHLLDIKDNLLEEYSRPIVVTGYFDATPIKDFLKKHGVSNEPHVYLEQPVGDDFKPTIYVFDEPGDECRYILNEIARKASEDKDYLKKCFIYGADENYYPSLKFLAKDFGNLPIAVPSPISLFGSGTYKRFRALFLTEENPFDVLIKEGYSAEEISKIQSLYLRFKGIFENKDKELSLLDQAVKNISKPVIHYETELELLSSPNEYNGKEGYFLNFNLSSFPKGLSTELFLEDEDLIVLGYMDNIWKAREQKERERLFIKNNHLFISFSNSVGGKKTEPSTYFGTSKKDLKQASMDDTNLSQSHDNYFHRAALDDKHNYGPANDDYIRFKGDRFPENTDYLPVYRSFNAGYQNQPVKFSYSSLDKYYACPFQYYCSYILSLSTYEDTMHTYYGTLAHEIFEGVEGTEDFETLKARAIKNNESQKPPLTKLEEALIENEFQHLKISFDKYRTAFQAIANSHFDHERDFGYEFDEKLSLGGRIDLVITYGRYYSILDFKTGDAAFSYKNLEKGRSLQLPLYYFLSEKDERFENLTFQGAYIASIKAVKGLLDVDETIALQKDSSMLFGPFLNDLLAFDQLTNKLDIVKNSRTSKKGFYANSNARNSDFLKNIALKAEGFVRDASKKRNAGDFPIKPDKETCKYCPYSGICYKTEQITSDPNIVDIDEINAEEEDDGMD